MEDIFESLFALIVVGIGIAAKFAGQAKKVKIFHHSSHLGRHLGRVFNSIRRF